MIVYRLTDRIPVTIGSLKFWLSPMSSDQKIRMAGATKTEQGIEVTDAYKVALYALKFSIKGVEGLKLHDGSDYKVEVDENGDLSDESLSMVIQVDGQVELAKACSVMAAQIKDPKVKGVKFDLKGVTDRKKLGQ